MADEAFAGALVWDRVGHAVDGGAGWAVEFVAVVVEDEAGGDWGGWAGGAAGGDLHVAGGVVPDNAGAHGFGSGAHWQKDAAVFDDRRHVALDEGAVNVHRDGAAGLALRCVRPIRLRRRRQHSNKRRHQHSGQDDESFFHNDVPPFFEYDYAFIVLKLSIFNVAFDLTIHPQKLPIVFNISDHYHLKFHAPDSL